MNDQQAQAVITIISVDSLRHVLQRPQQAWIAGVGQNGRSIDKDQRGQKTYKRYGILFLKA